MGQAYDKLINLVQSSIESSFTPDVVEGTVVNDNPITVEIDKNSLLLDIDFLIIPEHLLEHDVDIKYEGVITFNGETSTGLIEGKLTVKSQLQIGDAVIMMNCLGGQRYLVLDRL